MFFLFIELIERRKADINVELNQIVSTFEDTVESLQLNDKVIDRDGYSDNELDKSSAIKSAINNVKSENNRSDDENKSTNGDEKSFIINGNQEIIIIG